MSPSRIICSLSAIAVLVGWYQLPVLAERSRSLDIVGQPMLTQALESAISSIGEPAVMLRNWGEQQKLHLQASLLESSAPFIANKANPVVLADATAPKPATDNVALIPVTEHTSIETSKSQQVALASTSSGTTNNVPGSAAEVPVPPVQATPTGPIKGLPVTAVLAGDSVMGEIAFGMQRWAAKSHAWTIVDAHKVSSGLSNSGYYDWPATFHSLMEAHHPQVVLMMVGANDGQDIFEAKHRQPFGSEGWRAAYGARVQTILKDAAARCVTVYWTLPPIVRESSLEKRMTIIRQVLRQELDTAGPLVHVIDMNQSFVDGQGRYKESVPYKGKLRALRSDDGVHLTWSGAQVFVDAILAHAQEHPLPAATSCKREPAAIAPTKVTAASAWEQVGYVMPRPVS